MGCAISLYGGISMILDDEFKQLLTPEKVKEAFEKLKLDKTDIMPSSKVETIVNSDGTKHYCKTMENKVKIAVGCDGISYEKFENELSRHALYICDKGRRGDYQFRPFKEIETAKPPYGKGKDELAKAKKDRNKIRILSISTIRDTIFQKILTEVVSKYAEKIFAENIDFNSYGYRDGKSSKDAVKKIRRYIDEGYVYILDGDIKQFFDKINHDLLIEKMECFFGADNKLIQKYLKRFIRVKKIPTNKKMAEKRPVGIPQGGVLSGLLANVFLFNFDLFVVNTLTKEYEFKYIRYADDFVLLFKTNEKLDEIFKKLEKFLADECLTLHPLPPNTPDPKEKYSKKLNLSKGGRETLDFLGFEISEKFLRVKDDNIQKFKKRIAKTLKDIKIDIVSEESHNAYFYHVVTKINKKITALEGIIEHDNGLCPVCKKLIPKRSWIGYFMMENDIRQLMNIDTMIRSAIYKDYRTRTCGSHLNKDEIMRKTKGIQFVTKTYYEYRRQERRYKREHGKIEYCKNKNRYYDPIIGKILTPTQGEYSCADNHCISKDSIHLPSEMDVILQPS